MWSVKTICICNCKLWWMARFFFWKCIAPIFFGHSIESDAINTPCCCVYFHGQVCSVQADRIRVKIPAQSFSKYSSLLVSPWILQVSHLQFVCVFVCNTFSYVSPTLLMLVPHFSCFSQTLFLLVPHFSC